MASKWKNMYDDLKVSARKSASNLRERVSKAEETGEAITVAGGVAAGLADAADLEIVLGQDTPDPMGIPAGLAGGPVVYMAGRYMKSSMVRKLGVGLTTGGAAILTAEKARPWFA